METPIWVAGAAESMKIGIIVIGPSNKSGPHYFLGRVNPADAKRKSDICHTLALQTDPPQTVAFGGSRFLNSCWKSHTAEHEQPQYMSKWR